MLYLTFYFLSRRLYPIGFGLQRLYLRDITLQGYNIPAKVTS